MSETIGDFLSVVVIFIISLIGTTIGGAANIGGSIFMKPMYYSGLQMDATQLSMFSAKFIATFMTLGLSAKTVRVRLKQGFEYDKKFFILTSFGILLGIFAVSMIPYEIESDLELFLQGLLYILVVFYMFNRDKFPKYNLQKNYTVVLIVGITIGFVSSFFAVGGASVKIPLFIILYSMSVKEAGIYTFLTMLVHEPIKLFQYGYEIVHYDTTGSALMLVMLISLVVVPAAFIGSSIGAKIQNKSSDKMVGYYYTSIFVYTSITLTLSGALLMLGVIDTQISITAWIMNILTN